MRRRVRWGVAPALAAITLILASCTTAGSGAAVSAIEVPGTAALNTGAEASVIAVSCASAGNCAAAGYYGDRPGGAGEFGLIPSQPGVEIPAGSQPFVVDEVNGSWGVAQRVRFPAGLDVVGGWIAAVSCAGRGSCSAGGSYLDRSGGERAFVISEVNGTWGSAREVPGTAAYRDASVTALSCASPGNCSAGGLYQPTAESRLMFVASEATGSWGLARPIPGISSIPRFGMGGITSISCASPGNCSAGGSYQVPDPKIAGVFNFQAFVISQQNGTWGAAIEVPGTAALNQGGDAQVASVSCPSPGNCSAGGSYRSRGGRSRAFVVGEVNGTWGRASQVPGTAALMRGPGFTSAYVGALSCASPGNCSAGGFAGLTAYVVSEVHGTWETARPLSGTGALERARLIIMTVSCGAPGACSAAGHYAAGPGSGLFVVTEVNGTWGPVRAVTGATVLTRHRYAEITSVSCDPEGDCSAGGTYPDGKYFPGPQGGTAQRQAFVLGEHR